MDEKCPKCGAPLPADSPAGCPACLLAAGIETQDAAAPEHESAPPLEAIARAFPELEVIELIGRGGMGIVYKARQAQLDRVVALKILAARVLALPGFAERFSREARLLARLDHPGIVRVHDFGKRGEFFYLVIEYVDGLNLRQLMAHERLAPQQALGIVPQICEALEYAHAQGVVHRDIKPENILLTKSGRVKIADFGLAKVMEPVSDRSLTISGHVMGTPHYMAPEQIERPTEVDHRADIYSLGVVFYEMLTGELPLGRFRPPSERVSVDVRLDEVVLRALERERERRYQSAADVRTEVSQISQSEPHAGSTKTERSAATGSRLSTMAVTGFYGLLASAVSAIVLAFVLDGEFLKRCVPLLFATSSAFWVISIVAWVRIASSRRALHGLGYAITGTLLPVALSFPMIFLMFALTGVEQESSESLEGVMRVTQSQPATDEGGATKKESPQEVEVRILWNSLRRSALEHGMESPEVARHFISTEDVPSDLKKEDLEHAELRAIAMDPSSARGTLTAVTRRGSDHVTIELRFVYYGGGWRFQWPASISSEPVEEPAKKQ